MTEELDGKTCIVTGATGGIGTQTCQRLAESGANLALVARSAERLDALRERLNPLGVRTIAIAEDLAGADSPERIVAQTVAHFGGLDILINNAGLSHSASIPATSTEDFDRCMAINARAPFLLCKAAIPHLLSSKYASIINVASVAAHKGYAREVAYAASKHALLGITKVLATELHQQGVRVHAVSTGGVATSMVTEMHPDADLSAFMSPVDVAEVILFLLRNRSNAVIDEIRVRRAASAPSF